MTPATAATARIINLLRIVKSPFCSLEIHPERGIRPLLVCVVPELLFNIFTREHVTIRRLQRHLAIGKHTRPGEVEFVSDVLLSIRIAREDIDGLRTTIPVIPRAGEIEVVVPDLKVVARRWTDLDIRRWG